MDEEQAQAHLGEIASRAVTTWRAASRLSLLLEVDPAILRSPGIAARVAQLSIDSEEQRDEQVIVVCQLSPRRPWWRRAWSRWWGWVARQAQD